MQRFWRMAKSNMLEKVSASCDWGVVIQGHCQSLPSCCLLTPLLSPKDKKCNVCMYVRGITWMKRATAEVLIYVCHSCVGPVQQHQKLCVRPICAQEQQ